MGVQRCDHPDWCPPKPDPERGRERWLGTGQRRGRDVLLQAPDRRAGDPAGPVTTQPSSSSEGGALAPPFHILTHSSLFLSISQIILYKDNIQ